MARRQWADNYGPRWYLYYNGRPPHDDDDDYVWRYSQWVKLDHDESTQTDVKYD